MLMVMPQNLLCLYYRLHTNTYYKHKYNDKYMCSTSHKLQQNSANVYYDAWTGQHFYYIENKPKKVTFQNKNHFRCFYITFWFCI